MIILMEMEVGAIVGIVIGCVILGLVGGFFGARFFFKKQLEKNPPISEKTIRVMFAQMGRTPSEKQIREIMRSVNSSK